MCVITYSAIKKNEMMLFASMQIDLEVVILMKIQSILGHHLCITFSKMIQMNLFTEQKQIYRQKTNLLPKGIFKTDTNELVYKIEIDSQIGKTNLWLPKGKER